MAKQKGIIWLQGKLNGKSYYLLKGECISLMASSVSKAIRTGFLETAKDFQDTKMPSHLTVAYYQIIQEGSGPSLKREVSSNVSLVPWFGIQNLKQEGTQPSNLKNMQVMLCKHAL
ncbi:hypothetical protein [Bizionia arctica]|uniref:Uncharacterized protein n=1 Tax=Bizionia arctica TaxID=1495645 RepID=A0A917GHZ7_9FLAO|nr:hypothetical protein [Bizionia arctica]GGG46076.1 hypothetical protein GCM10010976_17050 [Bizionia arctica]